MCIFERMRKYNTCQNCTAGIIDSNIKGEKVPEAIMSRYHHHHNRPRGQGDAPTVEESFSFRELRPIEADESFEALSPKPDHVTEKKKTPTTNATTTKDDCLTSPTGSGDHADSLAAVPSEATTTADLSYIDGDASHATVSFAVENEPEGEEELSTTASAAASAADASRTGSKSIARTSLSSLDTIENRTVDTNESKDYVQFHLESVLETEHFKKTRFNVATMQRQSTGLTRPTALLVLLSTAVVAGFSGQYSSIGWSTRHHRTALRFDARDSESIEKLGPDRQSRSSFLEDESGNVHIPSTGVSISDEMEAAQKDSFVTEVVAFKDLPGVAQLRTSPIVTGSFEPMRYLVALSLPSNATTTTTDYVMIDVPPFSPETASNVQKFFWGKGRLRYILITSRYAIHYDEAPAIFSTRRADLDLWKKEFPGLQIVGYRMDIPRDCRYAVDQVLDGYGPFALQEENATSMSFIETGRPLRFEEWNHAVAEQVLSGTAPPDDNVTVAENTDQYSPEAIRGREIGKRILAVYTPGHSFGSMSYILPELGMCCSGFTIPIEDNRADDNNRSGTTGPALDCRGYITTSSDSGRQFESARALVNLYVDRFHTVLPARGDPLLLRCDANDRKEILLQTIEQYEKIGEIYQQLGIVSDDADDE
jgi:hypothetical protein